MFRAPSGGDGGGGECLGIGEFDGLSQIRVAGVCVPRYLRWGFSLCQMY